MEKLTLVNKNPTAPKGLATNGPGRGDEPSSSCVRFSDLYFEEYVAAVALLIVVGSVSWGVVTRYVSHTPSIWTGEVARIAFAWTVFVGAAAGFRRSEHIVIDVLLPLIPASLAALIRRLSNVIVLVVLVVMTLLSTRFAVSTYAALTPVLRLPQSVIYAAASIGFALMTFRHLQRMHADKVASTAPVAAASASGTSVSPVNEACPVGTANHVSAMGEAES